MPRELKFFQAVHEALDLCMEKDPCVYTMGLGVPDPKGIFGTTLALVEKYGPQRVLDMPVSESAMTGVALGSALVGMRPVLTHQRLDFALYSMDQIVNHAAKWHYMFAGKTRVPLVIRMIVGRGWGQGAQHSQSLQAWFAHVPGLKVVMPATAHDAKGLLITSIEDDNPVIFIEHRWLYNISGHVPEGIYRVPLGKAKVVREGKDLTMVTTSYMTLEAVRSAKMLAEQGVSTEIIDVRSLQPLDKDVILKSVTKTGRLIVADTSWKTLGFSAEVVALAAEEVFADLKHPPVRIGLPACPTPATPALANHYYPRAAHLAAAAFKMLGLNDRESLNLQEVSAVPLDIPDLNFKGPF